MRILICLLCLIFNEKTHKKTYLVAQSINDVDEVNTDSRLKEHLKLKGTEGDYEYHPRLPSKFVPHFKKSFNQWQKK